MSNHPALTTDLRLRTKNTLVIRVFLASLALAVAASVWVALGIQQSMAPAIAADEQPVMTYQKIVVQPGDTLWEISSRLAQRDDHGAILEQIMIYNDLETSDLEVGQTLFVPHEQN